MAASTVEQQRRGVRAAAQTVTCGHRGTFLSGEREPAPREDFSQLADAVAHNAVHAAVEKLVDRPHVYGEACPVPGLDESLADHVRIYRVSNGLVGHRFPGAPPMLLLDHVGAKGFKRTTPLVYVEDDRDVVIVASKGGHPRNPAWYHNLRANPDTTVQIGAERCAVHARVATPHERELLWPKAVATYAGYRGYQQRTDRKIPLVILEPRRSPTSP